MNILCIDIGSSNIKTALINCITGQIITSSITATLPRLSNSIPEYFELDAEVLFTMIENIILNLSDKYLINGIMFSTQMHGFVYRIPNRADRYVSWQDNRCTLVNLNGNTRLQQIEHLLSEDDMKNTGILPKPSLGMCNLFALLQEFDTPPANSELFTLGSYINTRLGGHNICHLTNAAALGFADIVTQKWDHHILHILGFDKIKLPQIAKGDYEICGSCKFYGQEMLLYPDYGDQQVCILGSGATENDAVVNIATASQVSRNIRTFQPGPYEVRPFFENTYINTITNMPGGRNLTIITDFLIHIVQTLTGRELSNSDLWKILNELPLQEENTLKVDLSFYSTPDDKSGGSITGIDAWNLRLPRLLQAVYLDMAKAYSAHIPMIWSGKMPRQLVFAGGVSWKNPQLIKTTAQKMNIPYRLSIIPDEAFNGLYRLALCAFGLQDNLQKMPKHSLSRNKN